MSQPTTTLTPYDTGERCQPFPWTDGSGAGGVLQPDDYGNVDFDDDEGVTVVTVHVSRDDDGGHTVHVVPLDDEKRVRVEFHGEVANGPMTTHSDVTA